MKRIFVLMLALMAAMFISCDRGTQPSDGQTTQPTIQWNLTAAVEGDGLIEVGFPTGSIRANAAGEVVFNTCSDSLVLRSVNAVTCDEVINNPEVYTEDQIEAANEVKNSIIYINAIEGDWKVDITGYAKYGTIYIMIDEHFPKDVDCIDEELIEE